MVHTILVGDAREQLASLPDQSVQCCVTSPPYYGLRDYGVEGQIGLESTVDAYVSALVDVFREVRRVLKDDGTLWLNLGDSYYSPTATQGRNESRSPSTSSLSDHGIDGRSPSLDVQTSTTRRRNDHGLKPKDLIGIPWKVAQALQAPYYTGRIANERDRMWLAAIIDAEGSICGYTHVRKDDGTTRTGVHINITNSNMALLDEAHRIWPTSRSDHNPHGSRHLGTLPMRRWIAHNVDDKALLMRELYPYMIAKKKQALLAYNFFEMSKIAKRTARTGEAQQAKDRRAWIMDALSRLNHGEDVDVPSWCVEPAPMFEPGWYLRQDIIWSKPNPMPESVQDRCTKSHEYLFLLSKSPRYYYDADAIAEPAESAMELWRIKNGGLESQGAKSESLRASSIEGATRKGFNPTGIRNKRSVWTISTRPYKNSHFAVFPPKLIEPCILAGTSERGQCRECGAPWVRVVERETAYTSGSGKAGNVPNGKYKGTAQADSGTYDIRMGPSVSTKTTGWTPSCDCDAGDPVPQTVLDPFAGSGTTGEVAEYLGRRVILIELNPAYVPLIEKRLAQRTIWDALSIAD